MAFKLTPLEMYAIKAAIAGEHAKWRSLRFNGLLRYQLENIAAQRPEMMKIIEVLSMILDSDSLKAIHQIDLSQPPPAAAERSWSFVEGKELVNMRRVAWLIPSLLPEEGLTLVYGASGAGKSFFVLHLAMFLSRTIPVMYVATEGTSGYLARTAAWEKHYKAQMGHLSFCMGTIALLDDSQLALFIDDLKRWSPRLLVVDTMGTTLLPGDENSTQDMLRYVRAANRIQKEMGCAVLLVHHTRKDGEQERGNAALRGACDMMIKLSLDDDMILVECTKSKDGKAFDAFNLKMLPIQLELDDVVLESIVLVDACLMPQTKTDPLTPRQFAVLEALEFFPAGATPTQIEGVSGIGSGQVTKLLARLMRLGYVYQEETRQPYHMTQQGREAIDAERAKTRPGAEKASPLRQLFNPFDRTSRP